MRIVGVDEAGRGPLAGPVSIGVIVADESFDLLATFPHLNDSKKLTEKKREVIYELLLEEQKKGTVDFCVKWGSATMIDTKGLTHAVVQGVHAGVRKLLPDPTQGKVFLDGLLKASPEYEQETVVHGDELIPAIMLASVVAKVSRDRLMKDIASKYPEYGFEVHKGYGTKAHYAAIKKYGSCDIHRQLFLRKWHAQEGES